MSGEPHLWSGGAGGRDRSWCGEEAEGAAANSGLPQGDECFIGCYAVGLKEPAGLLPAQACSSASHSRAVSASKATSRQVSTEVTAPSSAATDTRAASARG